MKIFSTTDNAEGQLDTGINASVLSIVLGIGEGDLFPATKNGVADLAGTKNILNSTGIQAKGVSVGEIIENVSDGSVAVITSVSVDSITTTDLRGGSSNLWNNTNIWAINRFVVTAEKRSVTAEGVVTVTEFEKILIEERESGSDILTVNAGGRGYDGSYAKSFSVTDYIVLHSIRLHHENLKEFLSEQSRMIKTLQDTKADDATVQALLKARSWKNKAIVASIGELDLTDMEVGDIIDGVTLVEGDRVLRKDQTNKIENGIFVVQPTGGALRAEDFDVGENVAASAVAISEGGNNGDSVWMCTSDDAIVGTNDLEFAKISVDLSIVPKFGGDGSDGELDTSLSPVNIDLGGNEFVIKNYTTINVVTNNVTFSNPHPNGTIITIKSQGNVTISSTIDASGLGAQAVVDNNGNDSYGINTIANGGDKGQDASGTSSGTGAIQSEANLFLLNIAGKTVRCTAGGAGGSGGQGQDNPSVTGIGGDGGASLIIECAGVLNFDGTINVSGKNGGNGTDGVAVQGGEGGGGGGAGGVCAIVYEQININTGTVLVNGGNGGNGSNGQYSGTNKGSGGGGAGGANRYFGGYGGDADTTIAGQNGQNGGGAFGGNGGLGGDASPDLDGAGGGGGGGASGDYYIVPNTEFL